MLFALYWKGCSSDAFRQMRMETIRKHTIHKAMDVLGNISDLIIIQVISLAPLETPTATELFGYTRRGDIHLILSALPPL